MATEPFGQPGSGREWSWTSAIRGLLTLAAFVASFLAVASLLRSQMPLPTDNGLRAKVRAWRDRSDRVDLLFMGSSIVQCGIDPDVVDPLLAAGGRRVESFNLGVPGMNDFELDALLTKVLRETGSAPDWIVLEIPGWRAPRTVPGDNLKTLRAVAWHTPDQTGNVLASIQIEQDLSRSDRLRLAGAHLALLGQWVGNIGLGELLLTRLGEPSLGDMVPQGYDLGAARGYVPLEACEGRAFDLRRSQFLEGASEYQSRIEDRIVRGRRRRGPRRPLPREIEEYNYGALRAQVERIEAAGRRAVYLNLPLPGDTPMARELADGGMIPDLIDLNRPDLYPELFALENRYDAHHASRTGAVLLSQTLAHELARRLGDGQDRAAGASR